MNMEIPNASQRAGDQPHVVIPYSYADHEFAHRLAGALRREVTPWIDEVDMSAGVFLINRISHSVRPVDFVIPVISAASLASDWVQHELKTILTRESSARRVRVLPARIDGSALPNHLTSQSHVDFHGRVWKQAYDDLKARVRRSAGPRPVLPPAPTVRPAPPGPRATGIREKAADVKRVFLSYDYDNDGYYKDVLMAWSKSPDFAQFTVHDPPNAPVDGDAAEPLKRAIAAQIGAATAFLCVVGEKTRTNGWVEWEIAKADELGKRMIGVRINRDHTVSETLYNAGATWALSFTFEGIKTAMEEAHGT